MLFCTLFSQDYATEVANIFNTDHPFRQAMRCEDTRTFTLEDVHWQEKV